MLGREALATELRALSVLHRAGCGARVVRPLAVIEWAGKWLEDKQERERKWYYVSASVLWFGAPAGQQASKRHAQECAAACATRIGRSKHPSVQVHTQQRHLPVNVSSAHACSMQPAQRVR